MWQLFSGIALSTALLLAGPMAASAQNLFTPVVYINDRAITRYEIEQRQRFMQVVGGGLPVDAQTAESELIDDRLRMFAAEQMGIDVPPEGLQTGLEEFAGRAGLSAAEFAARLEQSGIDPQVFRDFVEAGVAWRGVIRQRMAPLIKVSESEIDRALKEQIETPIITRVLLSELIIPAPPGQEAAAMQRATAIAASRPNTDQFSAAARQYSASESSQAGGRLQWVNLDNLPPTLRPVILALEPGQTTQPLAVEGAVILFHLRDTQGSLRPGAKEQVLEYMTMRLGSVAAAADLAAKVRNCDDLYVQAGKAAAGQISRQTQSQNAIPELIATRLASLDDNETAVIDRGGAAYLVVLCSRQPALLVESGAQVATSALAEDGVEAAVPGQDTLPSREVMRDQLFSRKASEMADAYLDELRAEAIIRRP